MPHKKFSYINGHEIKDQEALAAELDNIVTEGWGRFGIDYIKENVLDAEYLILALCGDKIAGFASTRKLILNKQSFYYLEFTAIKKEFQGNRLSIKLNRKIMEKIAIHNLIRGKISFEVMAISPNPRVLGTFIRSSRRTFPSPYKGVIAPAPIWDKTKHLIKIFDNKSIKVNRLGCVVEGYYDNKPHLIYNPNNIPQDKDPFVNMFAKGLLRFEEGRGREFVIHSKINLIDFPLHQLKSIWKR